MQTITLALIAVGALALMASAISHFGPPSTGTVVAAGLIAGGLALPLIINPNKNRPTK